jgi:acyl carrier protein
MRISVGMNDNELLELMKAVVVLARPVTADEVKYTNGLDTPIGETGLDSLDLIMVSVYLSELYGVPEEIAKTMNDVVTLRDIFEFMKTNHTKVPPATAAECMELIK